MMGIIEMTQREDDKRHDLLMMYCYAQEDIYNTMKELMNCYVDLSNSVDGFSNFALEDSIRGLRVVNIKLKRIKRDYIPVGIRDRN